MWPRWIWAEGTGAGGRQGKLGAMRESHSHRTLSWHPGQALSYSGDMVALSGNDFLGTRHEFISELEFRPRPPLSPCRLDLTGLPSSSASWRDQRQRRQHHFHSVSFPWSGWAPGNRRGTRRVRDGNIARPSTPGHRFCPHLSLLTGCLPSSLNVLV